MLLALLAAAPNLLGAAHWNLPGECPHLMFHYMPWFSTDPPSARTEVWEHWKWDGPGPAHDPAKRRQDGLRDIASVYYPLIGPYSSSDRAVIRYHMRTIKAAGGEAVAIDWYGPDSGYDSRIPRILDEAGKAGLKVTICYEEKISFVWPDFRNPKTRADAVDYAVRDLNYVLSRYSASPAFLRRDGLPYIFQFNGSGQGRLGPNYFTKAEWEEIQRRLDHKILFGRQGLEPQYDASAPARFLWWSSDAKGIRKFGQDARHEIDAGKLQFFMSFVSPGFNDSGVSGWDGKARVVDRKGLSLLDGTFQNAFAGSPEIVQVVTWNDFNEGTVVEPTRQSGFQYLDAIATWWADKKGRHANLDAIRRPFEDYVAHASAAQRAELPSGSLVSFLARRPLKVEDPGYLEHLHTPAGF